MNPTVIVGMSGGVDSSVAAMLLKKQGARIECLFMKNWEDANDDACTSEEDYKDAVQVCDRLDLPLHSVNFAKEYWNRVFEYFLSEYKAGRTPNPDVLCNKEIKFDLFLNYALDMGAEKIAMGHYAQILEKDGIFYLMKGLDPGKDQSYFLYLLNQKQLSKSLFPVGGLSKKEVRQLAETEGLITSDKKDSTGICFIGERKFRDFLQNYLPAKPGKIADNNGNIIGDHDGLMYYTIGQRKGLGVGGGHSEIEAPWYVADKDLENNILIAVQGKDHPKLYGNALVAGTLHWIAAAPEEGKQYSAKIRYRQEDQTCRIAYSKDDKMNVYFDSPQFAIAPGQSVVLYDGNICMGGGIILEEIKS